MINKSSKKRSTKSGKKSSGYRKKSSGYRKKSSGYNRKKSSGYRKKSSGYRKKSSGYRKKSSGYNRKKSINGGGWWKREHRDVAVGDIDQGAGIDYGSGSDQSAEILYKYWSDWLKNNNLAILYYRKSDGQQPSPTGLQLLEIGKVGKDSTCTLCRKHTNKYTIILDCGCYYHIMCLYEMVWNPRLQERMMRRQHREARKAEAGRRWRPTEAEVADEEEEVRESGGGRWM